MLETVLPDFKYTLVMHHKNQILIRESIENSSFFYAALMRNQKDIQDELVPFLIDVFQPAFKPIVHKAEPDIVFKLLSFLRLTIEILCHGQKEYSNSENRNDIFAQVLAGWD